MVCVRAGDHVLLRGNNNDLSAMSLEATALENGTRGARVRARVAVTGALVEMIVLDARAGVLSGKAGPGW
jgi:flagella basal body P-ring formation protein FlgA